jgi:hypothetical protein
VLLEPGEKEEALVKDVVLEPAHTIKIRIVDPDSHPLAGTQVFYRFGVETLKGAEYDWRINPKAKEERQMVFLHKEKNLGFYLKELRGDTPGPLTIRLQPCGSVSGRLVDREGQPTAGVRLVASGFGLRYSSSETQWITTDKEGRFQVKGLVPRQNYHVGDPYHRPGLSAWVVVEPGKHKDVGDIKFRTIQEEQ